MRNKNQLLSNSSILGSEKSKAWIHESFSKMIVPPPEPDSNWAYNRVTDNWTLSLYYFLNQEIVLQYKNGSQIFSKANKSYIHYPRYSFHFHT